MAERDEIEQVLRFLPWKGVDCSTQARVLIAANVRHLPSLVDDPETVERVAKWLWYDSSRSDDARDSELVRKDARDLLRALAGGDDA